MGESVAAVRPTANCRDLSRASFADGPSIAFRRCKPAVIARNQSLEIQPYLERANVIVSSSNDLAARLHLERLNKPCVQASVCDARTTLAGTVTVWRPGVNCSCFGCLFPSRRQAFLWARCYCQP